MSAVIGYQSPLFDNLIEAGAHPGLSGNEPLFYCIEHSFLYLEKLLGRSRL